MEEVSPREEQGKPGENLEGLSVEARGSDKATLGATQGVSQPENHSNMINNFLVNNTV